MFLANRNHSQRLKRKKSTPEKNSFYSPLKLFPLLGIEIYSVNIQLILNRVFTSIYMPWLVVVKYSSLLV
jgi:hypothetical protein